MSKNPFPIEDRNKKLHQFFTQLGFNVKVIGNINQPKVIVDNSFAISGFVRNREYNFTTKPFGGSIIKTVNLYTPDLTRIDVDRLIAMSEKRKVWKVSRADTLNSNEPLYYVKTQDGVAYFAEGDARFFFDEESAISCQQYLTEKLNTVFAVCSTN